MNTKEFAELEEYINFDNSEIAELCSNLMLCVNRPECINSNLSDDIEAELELQLDRYKRDYKLVPKEENGVIKFIELEYIG